MIPIYLLPTEYVASWLAEAKCFDQRNTLFSFMWNI